MFAQACKSAVILHLPIPTSMLLARAAGLTDAAFTTFLSTERSLIPNHLHALHCIVTLRFRHRHARNAAPTDTRIELCVSIASRAKLVGHGGVG